MIVSSGEHFKAKSPAVQAEAVLFIDVELIHLSDHRFKVQQQEKRLGCILACDIDVCRSFQLFGYHFFFN